MTTTASADIVDQVLRGADLRVVLKANPKYNEDCYVESYDLPHIIVSGGVFWAAMRTAHLPNSFLTVGRQLGQDKFFVDITKPIQYCYSNFYRFVIVSTYIGKLVRYYNADAYETIDFMASDGYELVYQSSKPLDCDMIREKTRQGKKMKVCFELRDGVFHISPLHTAEVYEGKAPKFYTDADALPQVVFDHDFCDQASNTFTNLSKARENGESGETEEQMRKYNCSHVLFGHKFYSTFYHFEADQPYVTLNISNSAFETKDTPLPFSVFAEK